ncbi:NAD-dependent epimerase/dehydratase family protein [Hyphomicrobium sp. MC1]|uniref:NAD-dependent epimerase/dehydratase family protein n=1 Tax=Hyphomicrobium sp. (strain MC1) TaxID=717785 RepID=UPI000213DF0C|nr:NAD-dependent epimerase/dehydratase family protein [Hyphomicrobium sp. MC1]CCB63871.1 NAD-dependent epimerase/dehydratase [Hyphomicrobium sp. MC1]
MAIAQRILVTGASGFIGQHVVRVLAERGYNVRAASRHPIVFDSPRVEGVAVGDMSRSFAAEFLVRGVDAVVHAAGLSAARTDLPSAAYTAINVDATRQLARAARSARVKRFVLMSSIRAQVGVTYPGLVTEATPAAPTDAYGRSKQAAEAVTAQMLDGSATRWTVLRPVLVYGPGVKGNMAALLKIAALPVPLPFGALKARRSLVSIGNLISALQYILQTQTAENAAFIVADPEALTMAEIIRALRRGLGRPEMLLPVPDTSLARLLRLAGKGDFADRLTGDLVVDAARLRRIGWAPPETTAAALAASVATRQPAGDQVSERYRDARH